MDSEPSACKTPAAAKKERLRWRERAGDMHPWLREFQRDQIRWHLSPRTIESRYRTLRLFLETNDPATCDRERLEKWLDCCRLTARSRATYVGTLKAFFGWAIDTGHRVDDPTRGLRRPKTSKLIPRPIGTEDLRMALRMADPKMRAWLMLGAFAGFRAVEIAGLQRADILEASCPPLLVVSHAKGGRERTVPLHPDVEAALRVYGLPGSGPVFRMTSGKEYRPQTISAYVARFFRGLGISATCHQTRHFFATRLYAETRDIRLVQEMLGHSRPETTAIYAAFSADEASDAVRNLTLDGQKRIALPFPIREETY